MERRFNSAHDIEVEERDNQTRFTGIASVFYDGTPATEYTLWEKPNSRAVERIMPEAFDKALAEDHDVRALFNHDPNWLLGRSSSGTLSLSKEGKGLRYRIQYDPSDDQHRAVAAKIKRGDLTGSSFGFQVTEQTWTRDGNTDVRSIKSVRLLDVSPVTFPAYENGTTIGMRNVESITEAEKAFELYETQRRIANKPTI